MTKYRNEAREEAEDKELEALEAEYKKQFAPKEEGEEEDKQETPPESPEEKTWKERYANLRSYADKTKNDLLKERDEARKEAAELKKQKTELPETIEEAREWVEKYPDLARVLKTLIREDTKYLEENVAAVQKDLEKDRLRLQKQRAEMAIAKAHPDFFELRENPDFAAWVNDQPVRRGPLVGQSLYDALYKNDTDAASAIEAINVYKDDLKKTKNTRPDKDAARTVAKSSGSTPPVDGKRTFSESQIDKMSSHEYDRLENEIDEARRDGRIVYDITGAAR